MAAAAVAPGSELPRSRTVPNIGIRCGCGIMPDDAITAWAARRSCELRRSPPAEEAADEKRLRPSLARP